MCPLTVTPLALHIALTIVHAAVDDILQDTRSVVGKMEVTFAAIIHIILVFFYLSIFQVSPTYVLLSRVVINCSFQCAILYQLGSALVHTSNINN